MAVRLFIFNGRGAVSEEEIELGTPDEQEARNLPFHVKRCALRYRNFTRRQAEHSAELTQIKLILLVGTVLMAAVSGPGQNLIQRLTGIVL